MPSLVIVGAQWGDEGKGKLVDYLTSTSRYVVRFQGGNNAGHTLVVNGRKTKLSLVPSGILHPETICCLGAGVVLNPEVLLAEIAMLREAGVVVSPERLIIDRDAHLILDYHVTLDQAFEAAKGDQKIGTTGRGIGPAYQDRAARSGVRVAELVDIASLKSRVAGIAELKNEELRSVLKSSQTVDVNQLLSKLERFAQALIPFIGNVGLTIDTAIRIGEHVVFEGAQGTLLDQTFGTVPFITSSNTIAAAAATGTGIGPRRIDYVLGVAKAYATRVGSGPFPTELKNEIGDRIRERGQEFGTVTGRPRRCGWLDAFALKRAVRLNGLDSLAVTKLDVLSGVERPQICTGYSLDGQRLQDLPALLSDFERVQPVYSEFAGWEEPLEGVTSWEGLPRAAQEYLEALQEEVGSPVSIVSVGAERSATLFTGHGQFIKKFLSSR